MLFVPTPVTTLFDVAWSYAVKRSPQRPPAERSRRRLNCQDGEAYTVQPEWVCEQCNGGQRSGTYVALNNR